MKQFALLLLFFSSLSFAVEYGKEGVKEVGGFISLASYTHNQENDSRHGEIAINPHFNWFIVENMYVGPRFHLNAAYKTAVWGVGASIGYAFLPDANIIPFGEGGLQFIYSGHVEKGGLAIPLNGGVKFPVLDNLLVGGTAGCNIKFLNKNPGADFTMGFGITAIF